MSSATRRWLLNRRVVVAMIVALILGAMVNIGVAWRIALNPPRFPLQVETNRSAEAGPLWLFQLRTAENAARVDATAASKWAAGRGSAIQVMQPPRWSTISVPPATGNDERVEEAFGYPKLSMGLEVVRKHLPNGVIMNPYGEPGIVLNQRHPHENTRLLTLPLRPLWGNFIINTLFYALFIFPLLFLIMMAFRYVCRTRRINKRKRENCCLKCGYSLRGDVNAGCPECGWNRSLRE